jgi:hypothetical protein
MPTPHTRIQLERFLATVQQRRTMAPILRYARDRSKPKFVGILDSTTLYGDAIIARDLIQTCIRSNPCGMFGCPECGRRLKRREKREARHVPPRVIFAREGDLAGQVAHRLVSLQYMCQRGLQGIRLKLNMKTTNYWKADVLFREDGSVIEVSDAHRRLILGRKLRGGNRGGLQDVTGRPRTAYEIELLIRASKERAAEKERARVAWLHGWMTDEEPAEVKPPSSSS